MDEENNIESRHKGFYIKKLGLEEENITSKTKGVKKPARECAREARERKKIYLNKIESELEETKQKLKIAEEENEQLRQLLKMKEKSSEKQKNVVADEGFEKLMIEFQRLYSNLRVNDVGEIARSLSYLRDKYGISGRERLKNMDSILDRFVGVLMPMHYRLLMENATKSNLFFIKDK